MSPELAKRLALVFPAAAIKKTGVTGVAGVADVTRYAQKPEQLRQLRLPRHQGDKAGKMKSEGVTAHVSSQVALDRDAIEERAALAAESVPACYLDAWAHFQCQRPLSLAESEWWQAIDDAGLFLDAWGANAAAMLWGSGELFDVPHEGRPGGLVWQLKGCRVSALGTDKARLADGRTIMRHSRGDDM
jgi:hypothetical protein